MTTTIRVENAGDYRRVEELTRDAFWNHFQPGADEHFILHKLRTHADFIPELSLVMTLRDDKGIETIIASIHYHQAQLHNPTTNESIDGVLCFGPVSVHPQYQSQGYGSQLVKASIEKAKALNYSAILIQGDPRFYYRLGFRSAEYWNITDRSGKFSTALMALPLDPAGNLLEPLREKRYFRFNETALFLSLDAKELEEFDRSFPPLEKKLNVKAQLDFQVLSKLQFDAL